MRKSLIALAACGLTLVAAPAAGATTVGFDPGGRLVVTGEPAKDNIGLQVPYGETDRIAVYAGGTTVTAPSPACEQAAQDLVYCDWNPAAGARVDLGDGDDWGYVSYDLPVAAPLELVGGAGNDKLQSSLDGQPTTLDGGPGEDTLQGGPGIDRMLGGDGNDKLEGREGNDELRGGGGDDLLSGDGSTGRFTDVLDGGDGYDTVDSDWGDGSFDAPPQPVSLTLAGGADDGRAGENDDVRGVENVKAYAAATLVGTDAAEHLEVVQITAPATLVGHGGDDTLRGSDGQDRLEGGAGADYLDAGFGDDVIVAGPGPDTVHGDRAGGECGYYWCKYPFGNDTIDVRDGERDTVTCGAGQDSVQADAEDVVAPDCETADKADKADKAGTAGPGAGGAAAKACSTGKLRGLKVKAARKKVKKAGCTTRVKRARSKKVMRGRVIKAKVTGTRVTLTVSRGR